jgi:hypothetical protein
VERLDPSIAAASRTVIPGTPPRTVSKFEHDLLVVLRYLLAPGESHAAHAILGARQPAPKCLSRACVDLLRDSLGKGIVLRLVRAGGWREEAFLANGSPMDGRVWTRIPLERRTLSFGRSVLEFLIWLTASSPESNDVGWDGTRSPLPAEELFFAFAYDRLRSDPAWQTALVPRRNFAGNPFCWLFSPGDFFAGPQVKPPDFAPLFEGVRAVALECLQPVLARRWIASERSKSGIVDWHAMRRQAGGEAAMLGAFLAAAESTGRPDLARFVLRTLSATTTGRTPDAADWIGGLAINPPPRLADRLAIQRDALAVPRQAETFERWDRAARAVGYFDDGYAASQFLKANYDAANGTEIAANSKRLLAQLEPLKT